MKKLLSQLQGVRWCSLQDGEYLDDEQVEKIVALAIPGPTPLAYWKSLLKKGVFLGGTTVGVSAILWIPTSKEGGGRICLSLYRRLKEQGATVYLGIVEEAS